MAFASHKNKQFMPFNMGRKRDGSQLLEDEVRGVEKDEDGG
jgi:hypothetical protein